MYPPERQHSITQMLLDAGGRATVAEISERFAVTTETVRRDLDVLARRGLLRRVHGAAELLQSAPFERALSDRHAEQREEKQAIAGWLAAEMPSEGVAIIDSGSLTYVLAEVLRPAPELTIVTNNLPGAQLLADAGFRSVMTVPGSVRGLSAAAVDAWTVERLRSITADVSFVGVNGLTAEHGLTTTNSEESAVKRAMVLAGRKRIVPVISGKIGRNSFTTFAELGDVDLIVTDDGVDPELADELAAAGPEVVIVPVA